MFSIAMSIVFITFLPINYYIGKRGWHSLGRHVPVLGKRLYWIAFWALACTFPVSEMGEDALPAGVMKLMTYSGGYWVVAMLYFLLILLFVDLVRLSDKKLNYIPAVIKHSPKTPIVLGLAVLSRNVLISW